MDRKKANIGEYRKKPREPQLVCDCEDLLPYAWRNPMVVDERKRSKVLRELAEKEKLRNQPPVVK